MHRVLGSLLILFATGSAGLLYGMEQQIYLENLLYLRHIIYMIQGEIAYSHMPLEHVFGQVAKRVKNPYKRWLHSLEQQVHQREELNFFKIWMKSIDQNLQGLHLKSEHLIQLKELGSYLGRMDQKSETRNLQLYVERLELEIEKMRDSLEMKKRVGKCLGVLSGVFLIVVFI